jgi:hypothetical protein
MTPDEYEPPMSENGGTPYEKDEAKKNVEEFNNLIEYDDEAYTLLGQASDVWLYYNHCAIYKKSADGDYAEVYEHYIRKAFIDGYMVGYKLRLTGKTYGAEE